jgi:hypothetical protein
MRPRARRLLLVALAALVVVGVLGVLDHDLRLTSSVGGREVVGVASGVLSRASLTGGPSSVSLELGSRRATVTAETVSTDDGRTIAIPAECKQVEVRQSSDGLDVLLDGRLAN